MKAAAVRTARAAARPARRWLRLRRLALRLVRERAQAARALPTSSEGSTQGDVRRDYEDHYGRDIGQHRDPTVRPVLDGGRLREVSRQEIDAVYVAQHVAGLTAALPRGHATVLEIGAGYGRTLLPLASLVPAWKLMGVEPTVGGPMLAHSYANEHRAEIASIAASAAARAGIAPPAGAGPMPAIITADGRRLPLASRSVDASYTNLVLEQIPDRDDVVAILREAARVTRRVCAFLEPWWDVQDDLGHAYLRTARYLQQSTSILEELGFSIASVTVLPFQHNVRMRLAYVVAVPPASETSA